MNFNKQNVDFNINLLKLLIELDFLHNSGRIAGSALCIEWKPDIL